MFSFFLCCASKPLPVFRGVSSSFSLETKEIDSCIFSWVSDIRGNYFRILHLSRLKRCVCVCFYSYFFLAIYFYLSLFLCFRSESLRFSSPLTPAPSIVPLFSTNTHTHKYALAVHIPSDPDGSKSRRERNISATLRQKWSNWQWFSIWMAKCIGIKVYDFVFWFLSRLLTLPHHSNCSMERIERHRV